MTDHITTFDGRRLAYRRYGQGTPVVVLESGLGGPGSAWLYVTDELAKVTTVITYDRAGYGSSDPDPAPRTLSRIVDDLTSLVSEVSPHHPCVLAGHSYGGIIARMFAYRHPDKVAGMVLIDPSIEEFAFLTEGVRALPIFGMMFLAELLARAELLEPLARRRVLSGEVERILQNAPADAGNTLRRDIYSATSMRTRRREAAYSSPGVHELTRVAARLPTPRIPVTVISGTRTVAAERNLRPRFVAGHARYVATLPQGRHVKSERSAHMVPMDDPDIVIKEITRLVEHIRTS